MATVLEPVRSDQAPMVISSAGARVGESAVAWGAIFAGAAAGAALSLILLILGVGLGLSTVSPWTESHANSTALGLSTIAWITFTQLAASALGGYIAGRLRTRWTNTARDEVYFRDTAHGLLAWAVATLLTAGLLTSTIATIVGAGATTLAQSGVKPANAITAVAATARSAETSALTNDEARADANARGNATQGAAPPAPTAYYVDMLFRTGTPPPNNAAANGATGSNGAESAATASSYTAPTFIPQPTPPAPPNGAVTARPSQPMLAEVARIIDNGIARGTLPDDDVRYVAHLVAMRTGLNQPDAEHRVTDVFGRLQAVNHDAMNDAKTATEAARQASAYTALWLFISLLIGAFVASLMATYGGRQRDL